jgi:hypothetical protein
MDRKWKRCIGLLMMALTVQLVTGQMMSSATTTSPGPTATATFPVIMDGNFTSDMIMPDMTEIQSITETTQSPTPTPTQTPIPTSTLSSDAMPTTSTSASTSSSAMPPTSSSMTPVMSPSPTPTTEEV